jgi:hypothetical protein
MSNRQIPWKPGFSLYSLIIYVLLSLLLTYPLLFHLSDAVPNDIGDPLLNTWILAWDSHALLNDPFNLFNANIFYPLPNTLAYSEHLFSTALLALPIQVSSGEPILAYNLSLLSSFPLAAFGMYLLALHWTRRRSAAFIAGLIFGFAPYRFAAIAHLQLLTFQWLPFILLLVDKIIAAVERPARAGATIERTARLQLYLALLIFLLLQILASWYLALYSGLILGLYFLSLLLSHRLKAASLALLTSIFLISIFLSLAFILPYLSLLDELGQARPLALALSLAAAATDFLAAAPFNSLFGPLTASFRTRPNFSEENTLFLGFIAPLLALVALLTLLNHAFKRLIPSHTPSYTPQTRHYGLRFTPSTPILLTLVTVLFLSLTLTLPTLYGWLATLIPATTIIRVPSRWLIPGLFALAGLAAFGYAMINEQLAMNNEQVKSKNKPAPTNHKFHPSYITHYTLHFTFYVLHTTRHASGTIVLLTCASLLMLETLSIPLPLAQVENRATLKPVYSWLAEENRSTPLALLELPLHSAPAPEYPEVKRLYASSLAWWRLVNGYSGYTPPRQTQLAQALAAFPGEPAISTLTPLSPLPLYILVHPGEAPLDRSQWETTRRWQAERNLALQPLGQFEGDYLYRLRPPDPARFTALPLAAFGPGQNINLLAVDTEPYVLDMTPHVLRIAFLWQPSTSLAADYTVFIHFRAADGFVRGQADGPPVSNHYPSSIWQPDEIIQDIHPLPPEIDLSQVDHLAIGLYDPTTGERLPAFGPDGQRLADDALIIPVH